ncbi:MAG: nitroreductase [Saprospiraceae bacterium]|nr:nitroreductase [Saprospiraceae bacterium]
MTKQNIDICSQLIKNRRAIYPFAYIDKKIDKKIIFEILNNANYAPTHFLTQPWRFKVIEGQKLKELGNLLATLYKESIKNEHFSEAKYKKTLEKPTRCSHVIAICMERDENERLPEWEEIASTAMAVQNMWLTSSSYNIGAYWSSPHYMNSDKCSAFLNLTLRQKCLGFFYMGYHEMQEMKAKRTPMENKIEWL